MITAEKLDSTFNAFIDEEIKLHMDQTGQIKSGKPHECHLDPTITLLQNNKGIVDSIAWGLTEFLLTQKMRGIQCMLATMLLVGYRIGQAESMEYSLNEIDKEITK